MTSEADRCEEAALALVAPGKGILAADESHPTIAKRFKSIGVESTEENRRAYRELLFTTEGIEEQISGVILFDETLRQSTATGEPFPSLLATRSILPGIKVDMGAKPLAGSPGETVTEGLDGLAQRLEEYSSLGARFTKWRAVIRIGDGMPTDYCINANAHALARYAAHSIRAGLVPIVEPEVLIDGEHTIERCFQVTERTLRRVFSELYDQGVSLEQILLKPNMVTSGTTCPERAGEEEVASETIHCFLRAVPAAVPGVVFLSGGQSEEEATRHLNLMNRNRDVPWQLSFSFGRALQASVLSVWAGGEENRGHAQAVFAERARVNGEARFGRYDWENPGSGAAVPL